MVNVGVPYMDPMGEEPERKVATLRNHIKLTKETYNFDPRV